MSDLPYETCHMSDLIRHNITWWQLCLFNNTAVLVIAFCFIKIFSKSRALETMYHCWKLWNAYRSCYALGYFHSKAINTWCIKGLFFIIIILIYKKILISVGFLLIWVFFVLYLSNEFKQTNCNLCYLKFLLSIFITILKFKVLI